MGQGENTAYADENQRLHLRLAEQEMYNELARRQLWRFQEQLHEMNHQVDVNTDLNTRLNHAIAQRDEYIARLEERLGIPPVVRRLQFEEIDLTSDTETEYYPSDLEEV